MFWLKTSNYIWHGEKTSFRRYNWHAKIPTVIWDTLNCFKHQHTRSRINFSSLASRSIFVISTRYSSRVYICRLHRLPTRGATARLRLGGQISVLCPGGFFFFSLEFLHFYSDFLSAYFVSLFSAVTIMKFRISQRLYLYTHPVEPHIPEDCAVHGPHPGTWRDRPVGSGNTTWDVCRTSTTDWGTIY